MDFFLLILLEMMIIMAALILLIRKRAVLARTAPRGLDMTVQRVLLVWTPCRSTSQTVLSVQLVHLMQIQVLWGFLLAYRARRGLMRPL